MKYWKLVNSWGTGWGENGKFKVLKGVDMFGIESIGEAGEIK